MIFKEQICAFIYGRISQNEKTKIYDLVKRCLKLIQCTCHIHLKFMQFIVKNSKY